MIVGRPAPDFRMPTTKDLDTLEHQVTLADYRGRWLVLMFYSFDFSPLCPIEMTAFNDIVPALAERDAELLAVSTDSVFTHAAWLEFNLGKLDFLLASDRSTAVSEAYGVLDEGSAVRATFIIDPEGVVRHVTVHDHSLARSAGDVVRVLTALQAGGPFGRTI
jgi:peroxiredoxin (alkyl hydroperoxide reductase subunit C)